MVFEKKLAKGMPLLLNLNALWFGPFPTLTV
jgi:hypothetical protein